MADDVTALALESALEYLISLPGRDPADLPVAIVVSGSSPSAEVTTEYISVPGNTRSMWRDLF